MGKNKKKKTPASFKIRGLFIIIVVLILLGFFYKLYYTKTVHGDLNVVNIINRNELKSAQQTIDFYFDSEQNLNNEQDAYYTSILPFTVQAGIDLSKIEKVETENTITIYLPPANIINIDESNGKQKLLLIRDKNTGKLSSYFKSFRVFQENFAGFIAKERGLLSIADRRGATLINELLANAIPKDKELFVIVKQREIEDLITYNPVNIPIDITISKDFTDKLDISINDGTGKMGAVGLKGTYYHNLDFSLSIVDIFEGKGDDYMEKYIHKFGTAINPLNPRLKIYISNIYDKPEINFYYFFQKKVICFNITGTDKETLYRYLPKILPLVYQVEPQENFFGDYSSYGFSKELWENSTIVSKRIFFNNIISSFAIKFNEDNKDNKDNKDFINVQKFIRKNNALTDVVLVSTGSKKLDDGNIESIRKFILKNLNLSDTLIKNNLIAIFYKKNIFTGETYLLVYGNKMVMYYDPSFPGRNTVQEEVLFKNFSATNRENIDFDFELKPEYKNRGVAEFFYSLDHKNTFINLYDE